MFLKKLACAGLIPAAMLAQDPPKGIERSVDRFTKEVTDRSEPTLLDRVTGSDGSIYFGLTRILTPKDSSAGLALYTVYRGDQWLWVRPGASLLIKADDSTFSVARAGAPNTDVSTSGRAQEITIFPISRSQLLLLRAAKTIAFRFHGQNRDEDRDMPAKGKEVLDRFADFVARDSLYRYARPIAP